MTGALWPVPAIGIVLAIALGIALPLLDAWLRSTVGEPMGLTFTGGPSAARGVLSAIATSLISVTTLLFSLTIVTLQLASSQYSPRLLQTFVRDRLVQTCLAILLGTFVFALMVLRTVRSPNESVSGDAFVPRISVTVAFALTLASIAALVAFLSHQTRQLRVETMMRDVHAESSGVWARLRRQQEDDEQPDRPLPAVPPHAVPLRAGASGFLTQTAEKQLRDAVIEADAVLLLDVRPGDPVVAGVPAAWAWTTTGAVPDVAQLEAALEQALVVGYERAHTVDPSYGLRKLADIAVRALSPGINDPTTATHAVSHLTALLAGAVDRDRWDRRLTDESGTERLFLRSWEFGDLLDLAVTQIRLYGGGDPLVVDGLFGLLTAVAWRSRTRAQRAAVRRESDRLVGQCLADLPLGRDRGDVLEQAAAIDAALHGRWRRPGG